MVDDDDEVYNVPSTEAQFRASGESSQARQLVNAERTLDKAADVLRRALTYFEHKDQMNAAAHLSDRVMESPLAAMIRATLYGIDTHQSSYGE